MLTLSRTQASLGTRGLLVSERKEISATTNKKEVEKHLNFSRPFNILFQVSFQSTFAFKLPIRKITSVSKTGELVKTFRSKDSLQELGCNRVFFFSGTIIKMLEADLKNGNSPAWKFF